MATIKISDMRPTGTELFQDSESFLNELSDQEVGDVLGGIVQIQLSIATLTLTFGGIFSGFRCKP